MRAPSNGARRESRALESGRTGHAASAASHLVIAVWICFMLRGAFYACLLPMWEGYDEWAHYAVIDHFDLHRELPVATQNRISREVEQSLQLTPLPWEFRRFPEPYLTHDEYWKRGEAERQAREQQLGSMPQAWSRQPSVAPLLMYEALQPPAYYWCSSWLVRLARALPLADRVLLLRLWSIVIASLVVPFGFLTARRVFRDRGLAVGAVALIAAMPELMINVARVGNECLGIALFSIILYACLILARDFRHEGWATILGALVGLGLLTKAYFLTALPALACFFGWHYFRRVHERRPILRSGLTVLTIALAISAWWYARNLLMTGTLSGLSESVTLRGMSLFDRLRQVNRVDWVQALDSILLSHIWYGGWSGLVVRSWMYHFFYALAAAAALGLAMLAWRMWRDRAAHSNRPAAAGLHALAAFYACFWLGQAYNVLLLFLSKGASTSMGWYMYCLAVAEVLLVSAGLLAIAPSRLRAWILPAGTACFAALDLYTVHFMLIPYYTGLIAHKPNGWVAAFHVEQARQMGLGAILLRLHVNKPDALTSAVLAVVWGLFALATIFLVIIAVRGRTNHARLGRPGTTSHKPQATSHRLQAV